MQDKAQLVEKEQRATWQCEHDLKSVSHGASRQDSEWETKYSVLKADFNLLSKARDELHSEMDLLQVTVARKAKRISEVEHDLNQTMQDLKKEQKGTSCQSDKKAMKWKILQWYQNSRAWYLEKLPEL